MSSNTSIFFKFRKKNQKYKLVEGIVKSTTKGFGFLETNNKKKYLIPYKYMYKLIHGDKIIGKILIKENNKTVIPEKLIQSSLKKFFGFIIKKKKFIFIQPDFPYKKEILISNNNIHLISKIKHGDWVLAELTHHLLRGGSFFIAKIIKIINEKITPAVPWYIILSKYNLAQKSPYFDIKQINLINSCSKDRKDLTDLNFITIDSHYTKDIDDALFIQETISKNFNLIVAISDTTEYIKENSQIDLIAQQRSVTNYLPGLNISMLPKELSENLCSLKQYKKRPVLACKIIIKRNGEIDLNNLDFFLAWIKSKNKLSYENVSNWLENTGNWSPNDSSLKKQILLLKKIYTIRNMWRKKNALVFQEQPEYRFHLSEKWDVFDITIEFRRIAHKIVEESMIAANICAAVFLKKNLGFGIYNIHEGFDYLNAKNVSQFLKKNNIFFLPEELITLPGFCKLRRKLEKISDEYLNYRVRRFQSIGDISLTPKPHFILGFSCYATWTSPIRKYSDIINHRLIKSIIRKEKNISPPKYNVISHISHQKRKTRLAVKDLEDWLYVNFFQKKNQENKPFKANIIDIFHSGIKARLVKYGAFIFIPAVYIYKVKGEISLNPELGIIYVKNQVYYKVSDVINVYLLTLKMETKTIIACLT